MKNEEIILQERIKLMNSGVIGSTGKTIEVTDKNGTVTVIQEPEELHTPGGWKSQGYDIIPTETAIASFKIWRLKPGTNTMHKAPAYFFTRKQVEPINKPEPGLTKTFYVGQKVYWHVEEFGTERYIRAVVTEVFPDHAIAHTESNTFENYNGMNLWIDKDTEADFM